MTLGQQLAPHLPYLRRYARALTGNQTSGDAYVRASLQAIVDAPSEFPAEMPRIGLYRTFHAIWGSVDAVSDPERESSETEDPALIARMRLSRVTPLSRQALLLSALEGFTAPEIGQIIDVDATVADELVAEALAEIDRQTHARVLIIEDEPIIAMDIESIVKDLGHEVTGIAVTRAEAVALAEADKPGLVLADIQLADDSSGIDAVADILADIDVPVIFITAFPERLLTGQRPEPTFLITKPFQQATLKATIAQALFFDLATVPVH